MVVYPATAVVNLLDQFVRAPQSALLLSRTDPNKELVQITITEPDIDGLALRDLRLPSDVLILGIVRDGTSIIPHGHTRLRLDDEVMLIGEARSLAEVTYRFGY
jgi:Trk K+ transport system NAD-binding subunit